MQTNSRLVFISHSNSAHGAELCMTEAIKALGLQGTKEMHVLLQPGGEYLEGLLKKNGANIKHIHSIPKWVGARQLNWKKKLVLLKKSLLSFQKIFSIFKELAPDYVITNTIVCNPVFAIAAKIYGCKHVWYIHELGDKDHGYYYYFGKRFTWFIIKLFSDRIIVNSKFTREYFSKKDYNGKINVIYYAVPIDRFKERDPNFENDAENKWNNVSTWKILVAGRTVKGKGQEDIVNALGILKRTYQVDNFQLTILGRVDGEYSITLSDLIQQQGLVGNISMVSFTDDPSRFYKEAHIGVTTSRNEAFGRITVEYMKSNMVVIGANAGATNEIIENNVNGYLYELGNINQLAEILMRVMANKHNAKEFACNAKNVIDGRFNLDIYGSEIKDFL